MKLLNVVFILFVSYLIFKYMSGDVYEGYCAQNFDVMTNCDKCKDYDNQQSCNVHAVPKALGTRECDEGANLSKCGWNNSVSTDDNGWASESLKGKKRIFKYPNYYGYGTGSGFNYGEPYYQRTVNY